MMAAGGIRTRLDSMSKGRVVGSWRRMSWTLAAENLLACRASAGILTRELCPHSASALPKS